MIDAAWRRFSQHIGELGRMLPDPPFPQSERDTTDGYRYLTRLMVIGMQWAVEFADPDFPAFYRHDDDVTKWGGPNVDNTYLRAGRVRGDNAYRIVGTRGTSHGFLISECEGDMQLEQYGVYDEVWDDQLATDADGNFELIVSSERPSGYDGNWLHLHPDAGNITVRAYYNDWSRETPPPIRIERLGGEGLSPPSLTPDEMARRIDEASDWIVRSFHYWNRYVDSAYRKVGTNVVIARRRGAGRRQGHRVRVRVLPAHRRPGIRDRGRATPGVVLEPDALQPRVDGIARLREPRHEPQRPPDADRRRWSLPRRHLASRSLACPTGSTRPALTRA